MAGLNLVPVIPDKPRNSSGILRNIPKTTSRDTIAIPAPPAKTAINRNTIVEARNAVCHARVITAHKHTSR